MVTKERTGRKYRTRQKKENKYRDIRPAQTCRRTKGIWVVGRERVERGREI